jgi:hypothetical protein
VRWVRGSERGYVYVVWNWPVWAFTFMRWNHEDSTGVRVRLGFLKAQWMREKS